MTARKNSALLLLAFSLTPLLYQNCSDVSFDSADGLTLESRGTVEEVSFDNPVGPGERVFQKTISPFQPEAGPMNLVLLIDDSSSNVPFIDDMLNGLNNLLNTLPSDIVSISAYTTGSAHIASQAHRFLQRKIVKGPEDSLGEYMRSDEYRINQANPMATLQGDLSMSREQWSEAKQSFFSEIESHMNRGRGAKQNDYNPMVVCETLAFLSKQIGGDTNQRNVLLVMSDEDISANPLSRRCIKENRNRAKDVEKVLTHIKVEQKRTLEGGGTDWKDVNLIFPGESSCATVTRQKIDQWISVKSNMRVVPGVTYSSCYERVRTTVPNLGSPSFTGWDSKTHSKKNELPLASEAIETVLNSVGQGQFFMGMFALTDRTQAVNGDQEVADSLAKFVSAITPEANRHFQSLLDPNYDHFVGKILDFKFNTEFNKVSIADLFSQGSVASSIELLEVQFVNRQGQRISTGQFSLQGHELTILDSRVDLSLGGELLLRYAVK